MLLGGAVFYKGGFKARGAVPPFVSYAALGCTFGVPNAFLVWHAVGAIAIWLLRRTVYGAYLYAIGNSPRALFLGGAKVRTIVVATFGLAGALSSVRAIHLAAYTNQAYQGEGDPYLMPVVAAMVIGGTSIQGRRGTYVGTFVGAMFITRISSMLSIVRIPDAAREIIFGVIVFGMRLAHQLRSGDGGANVHGLQLKTLRGSRTTNTSVGPGRRSQIDFRSGGSKFATAPSVPLKPTTPQQAAGMQIEPRPSAPSASGRRHCF
jgi:ribose transport system permease protein